MAKTGNAPGGETSQNEGLTLAVFIQKSLGAKNAAPNQKSYQFLVSSLNCHTQYKPESVRLWYAALSDNVKLLSLDKYHELWTVIFDKFRWDFPQNALEEYSRFCLLLLSHEPMALKVVLTSCVSEFCPNLRTPKVLPPDKKPQTNYGAIHMLMQRIYAMRPTLPATLFQVLVDNFPNNFDPTYNIITYVQQLLVVIQYVPELRDEILKLIMERMVVIDKYAHKELLEEGVLELSTSNNGTTDSKEETKKSSEQMSLDNNSDGNDNAKKSDNFADKLDKLMCLLFEYINLISKTPKLLRDLFITLCRIFEKTVLTTVELPSVPFLMFYLCHLRPQFAEEFTSRLLRLCTDTGKPTHERCFAAAYVGGFISKAKYLRQASCLVALDILLQWLSGYVAMYRKSNLFNMTVPAKEAANHQLFYAVCHAAFRIYCRESECLESAIESHPQVPSYLQIILNSPLQPLKYCRNELVEEFVTALSQSSFGEKCLPSTRTLISHFAWLAKSSFADLQALPFDEYLLPKSKSYLDGLIRANEPKSPLREEEEDQDQVMIDNDPLNYLQHTVDPEAALTPSKKGLQEEDISREEDEDDMPMLNLNENVWDAVRNRKITLDVDTEDDCFME